MTQMAAEIIVQFNFQMLTVLLRGSKVSAIFVETLFEIVLRSVTMEIK